MAAQEFENNEPLESVRTKLNTNAKLIDTKVTAELGKSLISINDINKLGEIEAKATKNSSDTVLTDRANHKGSQPASTIVQSSTYRFVTDTEKNVWNAKLGSVGSSLQVNNIVFMYEDVYTNLVTKDATTCYVLIKRDVV